STPVTIEEGRRPSYTGGQPHAKGPQPNGERTLSRAERGFMRSSMVQLTLVRFREFVREPEAVFWTFVFPILLAAGLGIAFRQRGPDKLQVGVIGTVPTSAAVVQAMKKDSTLVVESFDDSSGALALRTGKIALLVVPAASRDSVRYVYDPARSEAGNARVIVDRAVQLGAGRADPVRASDTYVTEPGSRYIDFLIPGLLGMNLMGSAIWGMGFAIVDARRRKLLKRLIVTPMPRAWYLLSYILSRMGMLVVEVGALLGFGVLVFHVPVRGSLLAVLVLCLLGSLTFCALGLLIASRARTIGAASGLM